MFCDHQTESPVDDIGVRIFLFNFLFANAMEFSIPQCDILMFWYSTFRIEVA